MRAGQLFPSGIYLRQAQIAGGKACELFLLPLSCQRQAQPASLSQAGSGSPSGYSTQQSPNLEVNAGATGAQHWAGFLSGGADIPVLRESRCTAGIVGDGVGWSGGAAYSTSCWRSITPANRHIAGVCGAGESRTGFHH